MAGKKLKRQEGEKKRRKCKQQITFHCSWVFWSRHYHSPCFRVSVYWCMYSVITSEMRLYDGNWWQPVVIFRWLMMQASARGNRSKQLIYMARHNSPSSFSGSSSEECFCVCVCLLKREAQRGNRGLCEWYILNATQTPSSAANARITTLIF